MKIKVFGTAHMEGTSKKTGKPYNLTVVHTLMPARGVTGQSARQIMLDYVSHPAEQIVCGAEYNVEFDNTGYPFMFEPVPASK